jgi:phosphatidate cytidylyltransferase
LSGALAYVSDFIFRYIAFFLSVLATFFWCLIAPLWVGRRWRLKQNFLGKAVLLPLGLCLILAAWVSLVIIKRDALFLLYIMGIVCVAHLSACLTGRWFGGRKLTPDISPDKTWTGVYGALLGVLAYAVLVRAIALFFPQLRFFLLSQSFWGSILWDLVFVVLGIVGGLFGSLLQCQLDKTERVLLDRSIRLVAVLPCASCLFSVVHG